MENFEKQITKAEADFEAKLIATRNVELIESYTRFKTILYEGMHTLNNLIDSMKNG